MSQAAGQAAAVEESAGPDALPPRPWAAARWLGRVSSALAVAGTLGTVAIMTIINLDVGGRYFFGKPFPATAEIVSAGIVSIVFLQLAHAVGEGRSIRSDMLIGRLRRRSPRWADALDAVHHLAGAAMLAVLVRYVWPKIVDSIADDETVGLYGILQLPAWPFAVCVLAGAVLAALQFLLLAAAHARAARLGRAP
ncbi:TRAP transporter small permease subunit [Albimonas pacifica]|uniref:TRAP transporter small permease protein n=1 Tax=Albimonas pacifica TaxID=1114924 RepID=A0A1I3G7N8_9RHOB|nr:TRAP transporter small permease [Albimonas pacifica]SFI19508.1 TRAP-type mannitol/chloroaromatic compound transport system, small permease component [Albimonas pacifica]